MIDNIISVIYAGHTKRYKDLPLRVYSGKVFPRAAIAVDAPSSLLKGLALSFTQKD